VLHHDHSHSTVKGDIWALGCILAEMIANVRPWSVASPEDRDYNDFLVDRTMLYDMLPVSDAAYALLTKIFSPRPERRPSLAEIREEVLATDTFFLSGREAAMWGWAERLEKKLEQKMAKLGMPSAPESRHPSEETSSGSFYSGTSDSSSSSASCYSSGSSSSAFDSTSSGSEWSVIPITPPARVQVFRTVSKAPSRLDLGSRIAVAQSLCIHRSLSDIYDLNIQTLSCLADNFTILYYTKTTRYDIKTTIIHGHGHIYDTSIPPEIFYYTTWTIPILIHNTPPFWK
jgi:serine/threonine protein kinase